MLNHMDLNPAHFTALKVGKTAPSLSYHLPNFQLTESLLLMDFLVASRTIIYVQQAFFYDVAIIFIFSVGNSTT